MKRIILTLIMIFSILCQPCNAADKKPDISELKKPEGKYVEHKVCLYVDEKGTIPTYKFFYPVLDGDTRQIEADTPIQLKVPKDELQSISTRLYNADCVFYEKEHLPIDGELFVPNFNSNQFFGKTTLELKLKYLNGALEEYVFYFEKEDSYSDIVLGDVPHINPSDLSDVVVSFKIENFSKLLYPEQISVKSVNGKECTFSEENETYNVYGRVIIPFEPDGFERDYIVTIPEGTIMLDTGLNNEQTFEVHNDIEYVVPKNFLLSVSPMAGHIKYISGEQEDITITIKINKDFRVDTSKPIYFNGEEVEYSTDITDDCTILSFVVNVSESKSHSVKFGEGLIIGPNGEKNGPKHKYSFSVVDINTVDLPENLIFTDLPVDHWAIDYIVQLALDNIISGYEDKTFKPGGNVTRAEFAKMLAIAFDLDGTSMYDDVKEHWAKEYIEDCGEFIPCANDSFRPNDTATRQDVATALVNVLEKTGKRKLQEGTLSFHDIPMIDAEYISHMGKAVSCGIISGYGDGTFRPQEPITRAEIATMIYRVYR